MPIIYYYLANFWYYLADLHRNLEYSHGNAQDYPLMRKPFFSIINEYTNSVDWRLCQDDFEYMSEKYLLRL